MFPTVLVPLLIEKWAPFRTPVNLQAQYALLLVLGPYTGGALGLYRQWQPRDTLGHFYSGFPISLAIISALDVLQQVYSLALPVWFEIVVLIAVEAFVAFLCAIGEFAFDLIFEPNAQDDNFDTMTDMIASLTPSLIIAAALVLYRCDGRFKYFGSLLQALRCPTA